MTRILVIEDTTDIRNMIVMALKMKQYEVITATNGSDGIHAAHEHQPDLIICDIMMPLLNGYEVFKRLQDANIVPRTPFIFSTALDKSSDVRYGLAVMGADDYITKPFEINEFVDVVQSVLKRRVIVESIEDVEEIPNDIFISYSHDDMQYMYKLKESLEESGFRVWTDRSIEPSDDWAEALAEMITRSHCVVCMLSENAAQSTWVKRELGYAEAIDTRIFPILVHGNPKYSVPLRLINHQFVDARDDFDNAIQRLDTSIRDHLGANH